MARKRHTRHSYRRSGNTTNVMGSALGVGGYVLYEALLQPKVAGIIGNGLILNVGELAVGVWLSRKGGIVGNVGKAAIVLNAYQIIKPLLANVSI